MAEHALNSYCVYCSVSSSGSGGCHCDRRCARVCVRACVVVWLRISVRQTICTSLEQARSGAHTTACECLNYTCIVMLFHAVPTGLLSMACVRHCGRRARALTPSERIYSDVAADAEQNSDSRSAVDCQNNNVTFEPN